MMKQSINTNLNIESPRFNGLNIGLCTPREKKSKELTPMQYPALKKESDQNSSKGFFQMPTHSAITVEIDLEEIDDRLELLEEFIDTFDNKKNENLLKIVSKLLI